VSAQSSFYDVCIHYVRHRGDGGTRVTSRYCSSWQYCTSHSARSTSPHLASPASISTMNKSIDTLSDTPNLIPFKSDSLLHLPKQAEKVDVSGETSSFGFPFDRYITVLMHKRGSKPLLLFHAYAVWTNNN